MLKGSNEAEGEEWGIDRRRLLVEGTAEDIQKEIRNVRAPFGVTAGALPNASSGRGKTGRRIRSVPQME
ncbi:MAG: hypothetical protein HFI45_05175 [Lachnospiraceae bacterium]|nr:hypothetical protein [Lachnospiraceae bacterium]